MDSIRKLVNHAELSCSQYYVQLEYDRMDNVLEQTVLPGYILTKSSGIYTTQEHLKEGAHH